MPISELSAAPIRDKAELPAPFLSSTAAMIYVYDFQRAQDFYVSKLGFSVEFAYGDPPFYGLVKRDRASCSQGRVIRANSSDRNRLKPALIRLSEKPQRLAAGEHQGRIFHPPIGHLVERRHEVVIGAGAIGWTLARRHFAGDDGDGVRRDNELRLDAVAPQVDLGQAVLPDVEDRDLSRSRHGIDIEDEFAAEGKWLRERTRRQA